MMLVNGLFKFYTSKLREVLRLFCLAAYWSQLCSKLGYF